MITKMISTEIKESSKEAPNYGADYKMVKIVKAILVANGMESGKPSVDLQLVDKNGNKYIAMLSGELYKSVAIILENSPILK